MLLEGQFDNILYLLWGIRFPEGVLILLIWLKLGKDVPLSLDLPFYDLDCLVKHVRFQIIEILMTPQVILVLGLEVEVALDGTKPWVAFLVDLEVESKDLHGPLIQTTLV